MGTSMVRTQSKRPFRLLNASSQIASRQRHPASGSMGTRIIGIERERFTSEGFRRANRFLRTVCQEETALVHESGHQTLIGWRETGIECRCTLKEFTRSNVL